MYTIEYWHGQDKVWKPTGSGLIYDLDMAKKRMRALSEQCDYCVQFHIVDKASASSGGFFFLCCLFVLLWT